MFCCGLIPHLELLLHADAATRTLVVGDRSTGVICASAPAERLGIEPGLTLRQAEHLCPGIAILPPDPAAAERARQALSHLLYEAAPDLEVRTGGVVLIHLAGLPDPRRVVRQVRAALRATAGCEPRLGMAPSVYTAILAARRARPGRLVRILPEEVTGFLAPQPVSCLGITPEQQERLDLLGLRTLGQLAGFQPARLQTQVGADGPRLVALARGGFDPAAATGWTAFHPWRPPAPLIAERYLEATVDDREALLFIGRALCEEIATQVEPRGAGVKRIRLRLEFEPGHQPAEISRVTTLRSPLASTAELFGLAAGWLRGLKVEAGVARIAFEVLELEGGGRRQLNLWTGNDGSREEVEAALERLQERFGPEIALRPQLRLPSSPLSGHRLELVPL